MVEKATLQFPIGQRTLIALVKKAVKERAKENEAKASHKPPAKKSPPKSRRRSDRN